MATWLLIIRYNYVTIILFSFSCQDVCWWFGFICFLVVCVLSGPFPYQSWKMHNTADTLMWMMCLIVCVVITNLSLCATRILCMSAKMYKVNVKLCTLLPLLTRRTQVPAGWELVAAVQWHAHSKWFNCPFLPVLTPSVYRFSLRFLDHLAVQHNSIWYLGLICLSSQL